MKDASSEDHQAKYQKVVEERDHALEQVAAMEKFLADYGMKWVGDGQHEGEFKKTMLEEELKHQGPGY